MMEDFRDKIGFMFEFSHFLTLQDIGGRAKWLSLIEF